MKKMRRLIPAFAMLLVAATMLSTASFAWFTMSTSATAEGMQIKAKASSSLLITKEANLNGFVTAGGSVKWEDAAKSLIPATHYDSTKHTLAEGATATYGLVTVDSTKVTAATGAYTGTTYTPAVNTTNDVYYVDYTVYIGASGAEITGQDLKATISIDEDLVYLLHNAVTIDFLVSTTSATDPTYNQKVNLEEIDAASGNSKTITLATNITIPQALVAGTISSTPGEDGGEAVTTTGEAVLGDYITVTMRVYFDGAETNAAGEYYVRNALAVTEAIGFGIQFDAVATGN